MKTNWSWMVVAVVVMAGAACSKRSKRPTAPSPIASAAAAPSAPSPVVPAPSAAPETTPVAGASPEAVEGSAENEAPDPIEEGLDHAWADDTEGCKEERDAKDEAFVQAYQALCTVALAPMTACSRAPEFLSVVNRSPVELTDKELARELKDEFGDSKRVAATCATLANDQLCNYQGRTYSDPYTARQLRTLIALPKGDCAALGKTLPGVLYVTGE